MELEQYFTLQELAQMLRVSERSIHRWISSGQLPAYMPGGDWRIRQSELEEFLQARKGPNPKDRSARGSRSRHKKEGAMGERAPDNIQGVYTHANKRNQQFSGGDSSQL